MKKIIFFFLCFPFLLVAQKNKNTTIAEVTATAEITDSLTSEVLAVVQLEMVFENKEKSINL